MSTSFNQELTGIGATNSDNNNNHSFNSAMKQHMFDKVLTPSDVGKLNRLVIPKQHAENYFPLGDNQNGTTLDFEDRYGKMWRFRYSYWNSSQSYVMTKGWSRFIKDKQLQAMDTVSFHRSYVPDDIEPGKSRKIMYIDWRNRDDIRLGNHHHYPIFGSPASSMLHPTGGYYPLTDYSGLPHLYYNPFQGRELLGYGNYGGRYYGDVRNPTSEMRRAPPPLDYQLGRSEPLVFDSFPVFPGGRLTPFVPPQQQERVATTKKLRLFGVDMEESSSSGDTMGLAGYSLSSPVVIKDDDQSSSLVMQLSANEQFKRKGKSLEFEDRRN